MLVLFSFFKVTIDYGYCMVIRKKERMNNFKEEYNFTKEEWDACLKVLNTLKNNPLNNPDNKTFGALLTKVYKSAKKALKNSLIEIDEKKEKEPKRVERKNRRTLHKEFDLEIAKSSHIISNALSKTSLFTHELSIETFFTELKTSKSCYCCSNTYKQMHSFYHKLCPVCATRNYEQRSLEVNLENRHVILTGGRVKLGYSSALKFLRSSAILMVTTRFPAVLLEQFKQEEDYETWKGNLTVYGLDLRNLQAVEVFVDFYKSKQKSLDILVNNAAQTIKYMEEQYRPLIDNEQKLLLGSSQNLIANTTPITNELKALDYIDKTLASTPLNRFGQPVDFREKNSWNSTLEEISTHELLEVNLINHISPYMLIKELTPLFKASTFEDKFIINVSSSEGQFSYANKTINHPHTNMTKAALNMMTRTSAPSYMENKIYMNSVDVGWISTGATELKRAELFEKGSVPPLDSVDGSARIFHPIYEALVKKNYLYGHLLKDFEVVAW